MIRTAMRISFEEAVRGTSRTVDLSQLGMAGMPIKTVELNVPPGGRLAGLPCCAALRCVPVMCRV
jgi:hypothetical protein